MKKKRNRITPKDCYRNLPKLSDCAIASRTPSFSIFVYATGETVLVSAPSADVAVYTLQSWLSSVGLDKSVFLKERFDAKFILSSGLLHANSCKNRLEESLF